MTDATDVTDAERASLHSRVDVLQDAVDNMATRVRRLDGDLAVLSIAVMAVALAVILTLKGRG